MKFDNWGPNMEMKLELVVIPVSNVDAAIDFYANKAGFHLDQDHRVNEKMRFVQLTPPGSACSIAFGQGIANFGEDVSEDVKPGSVKGLQVVVEDARKAREYLVSKGVDASEVQEFPWGIFTFFSDPDGNRWSVQQIVRKS
jgi:catechol 2,3-dioxygenase-like lactoylglutathione lyase family enzyme